MVLVVNMTTCHPLKWFDSSCVLNVGDHPKISHASYINYHESEELNANKILDERLKHLLNLEADISDAIVQKIQDGAKKTKHLPNKFKKYFAYF
jgi:hypothetical protein